MANPQHTSNSISRIFLRLVLLFFLFSLPLYAVGQMEFYAQTLNQNGTKVEAQGDVLILYQDVTLTADRAVYDKNSTELELFGNVVMLKGSETQLLGEYVKMNMEKKQREISPFFMLEKETQLWVSAQKTSTCDNIYEIDGGIVSGCNPDDPIWEIYFSSSDYNSKTKWVNLYNARFHIGGIPVFYTPYFGYSTNTKRRTGLLLPAVGLSGSEGAYYEQPVYIVISGNADLEIKPQMRSLRGRGLYSTLRFVDSKNSKGNFTIGYFQEKESYVKNHTLANDRHYGFGFEYENTDVLNHWLGLDLKGQSGLYSDIQWMNDVDYINLSSNDTINNVTSNQVYSRVNLFYNEDDNYYGAYLKYYLDLDPKSKKRETTIQKLPIVQYHHYLDAFLEQHLFYTLNMQATNFARKEGKKGEELEVNLPISLQASILDEYINLGYKTELNGRMIGFRGEPSLSVDETVYENGYYGSVTSVMDISSQTVKKYEDFSHTVGLSAIYTKFGNDKKNGYYDRVDKNCSSGLGNLEECEFYTLSDVADNVDLSFTQYIFDATGKEIIYHRLSQPLNVEKVEENGTKINLANFENELRWQMTDSISFYNNSFYNYERSEWLKVLNTIRYKDATFNVGLSYLYENKADKSVAQIYTNYLNVDTSYRYNEHYSYVAKYAFDVETKVEKYAEVGFLYSKRCWDFGLRYVENNRPVLLVGGDTGNVFDKYVYLTLIIKPLGGSEVSYRSTPHLKSN